MTTPPEILFSPGDSVDLATLEGRLVAFVSEDGDLSDQVRALDELLAGALGKLVAGEAFKSAKPGSSHVLGCPTSLTADTVQIIKWSDAPKPELARKSGAAIAAAGLKQKINILDESAATQDVALGLALRAYVFDLYRKDADKGPTDVSVTFFCDAADSAREAFAETTAQIEGVYLTRDLISEPANVLTTSEFADRLVEMRALGLEVEVLEEAELEKLGMRTLLAVGQGSESPSKVVVMHWKGAEGDPLALVGKGVVFDTGGISLKPGAGMEEMTMDMGGAGVVSGVMKTLALRKAKANVVGLVGLVENMPDGKATRPGDVVKTMKGDTVEIINTDAEGRLVLADVLWYAQERFAPKAMIDLATLTGAVIIALGHENAGVLSNDDDLAQAVLDAARTEGEGAWRLPLGEGYDALIKSRIADIANVGGRPAGTITAAQFLKRFVKDEVPWVHLDIAGVAYVSKGTPLSVKGATGWGVRTLDRLVRDRFED